MTDLVGLIAGIPGIVDGFVKTCRCIEAYKGVEKQHLETIANAIHYSKKLQYYAHFVDRSPRNSIGDPKSSGTPKLLSGANSSTQLSTFKFAEDGDQTVILHDAQQLLYDTFQNSLLSLSTAEKVVDDWTIRLKLNVGDQNRKRRSAAAFALTISDRLAKKDIATGQRKTSTLTSNLGVKSALLVIGCQQIEDAMGRLKHWLDELRDILIASPVLLIRLPKMDSELLKFGRAPDDDVLFVAMARERGRGTKTMETIKTDTLLTAQPLDDRKHNLMLVESEESPYFNCLVDRRNILHFLKDCKEMQALMDTELIARLFAEERDELGHVVSASVGVLPCCGFARSTHEYHDLVFRLPDGARRPRTLRSLLLDGKPRHSLNERLAFSIKLATAVLIVHSLGLVHKDIRPDSIIVVEHISTIRQATISNKHLGEPYLVAFNESRHQDSATVPLTLAMVQSAERRWASLYRHPRHLASSNHKLSEMRDDIYSLGICLLEVAIWTSLFIWDDERSIYVNDTSVCDLSPERYDKMLSELKEETNRNHAWLRQDSLVELAEERVSVSMGDTFRDIVIECLTFGSKRRTAKDTIAEKDLGRIHHQNQSLDFINNVLSKLRSLKLS